MLSNFNSEEDCFLMEKTAQFFSGHHRTITSTEEGSKTPPYSLSQVEQIFKLQLLIFNKQKREYGGAAKRRNCANKNEFFRERKQEVPHNMSLVLPLSRYQSTKRNTGEYYTQQNSTELKKGEGESDTLPQIQDNFVQKIEKLKLFSNVSQGSKKSRGSMASENKRELAGEEDDTQFWNKINSIVCGENQIIHAYQQVLPKDDIYNKKSIINNSKNRYSGSNSNKTLQFEKRTEKMKESTLQTNHRFQSPTSTSYRVLPKEKPLIPSLQSQRNKALPQLHLNSHQQSCSNSRAQVDVNSSEDQNILNPTFRSPKSMKNENTSSTMQKIKNNSKNDSNRNIIIDHTHSSAKMSSIVSEINRNNKSQTYQSQEPYFFGGSSKKNYSSFYTGISSPSTSQSGRDGQQSDFTKKKGIDLNSFSISPLLIPLDKQNSHPSETERNKAASILKKYNLLFPQKSKDASLNEESKNKKKSKEGINYFYKVINEDTNEINESKEKVEKEDIQFSFCQEYTGEEDISKKSVSILKGEEYHVQEEATVSPSIFCFKSFSYDQGNQSQLISHSKRSKFNLKCKQQQNVVKKIFNFERKLSSPTSPSASSTKPSVFKNSIANLQQKQNTKNIYYAEFPLPS